MIHDGSQDNGNSPVVDSVDECRHYAELCADTAHKLDGAALDYSPESLVALDRIIDEGWQPGTEPHGVITVMGCYVGETIIRTIGGVWTWEAGAPLMTQPHVLVGTVHLNPIGKVRKRFVHGPTESLAAYHEMARELAPARPPTRLQRCKGTADLHS